MPRFFTGDELGAIKSIVHTSGPDAKEWKTSATVLLPGSSGSSRTGNKTVQKLALHRFPDSDILLAAVHADGSASVHAVQDDSQTEVVHEWSEPRLREGQRFVGLSVTENAVYSCTSNGALRLIKPHGNDSESSSSLATLPTRLCEWRLSEDEKTFAYGGDEVDLSLWDTERAFLQERPANPEPTSAESKKRKRGDQLLPGELWRAKNVPNDHLSLRQPVYNTALTYLQPSSSMSHQHLLVGTANGNIRRYDTRAGRRPVSDWKGIGKMGGINSVERGSHENQVFVADRGCMLAALDLRNGRTIYAYKGISGAVTTMAPAQSLMASVSQDRFVRLHTTFGPPVEAGQQQDRKGEVLDKLYMKVIPTVIAWDGAVEAEDGSSDHEEGGADDVWDAMPTAQSDSEDEGTTGRRSEKKTRTRN